MPLQLPQDASIDRRAVDSSSLDQSSEDGAFADDASDAGSLDRSSQDRQPDEPATEAGAPSDADGGATDRADADAAPVSDVDAADDADAAVDTVDARDGDIGIDGVDARDARTTDRDGGCACTIDDGGGFGYIPLACACGSGTCPAYDVAINYCPPVRFPEDNRIDTYAGCNLVVITTGNSIGIGGSSDVFDATTHELVGVSGAGDYPNTPCGDAQVFGIRAGTFPPATCARTSSVQRCGDGGDGG
jgi:hypothetical protein